MDKKPYLFLDVDGCLNVFGFKPQNEWGDQFQVNISMSEGQTFSHKLSKNLGAALVELPVEIIWLTTWTHDAWKIGKEIGLEDNYKVLDPKEMFEPGKLFFGNWKHKCLIKQLKEDPRDFIWIDDDAIYHFLGTDAENEADTLDVRSLFITPDNSCGISRAHIEEIKEFLGVTGA